MMRPIKDSMAIVAGLEYLPLLMLASFILLIVLSALLTLVDGKIGFYLLSVILLILFPLTNTFSVEIAASISYIILSSLCLLILTQFWRSLSEASAFNSNKAFGTVIAFGTLGAITGSGIIITLSYLNLDSWIVTILGMILVMAIASFSITLSYGKSIKFPVLQSSSKKLDKTKYGSFILLYSLVATYLYYQQLEIVDTYNSIIDSQVVFALRDIFICILTFSAHRLIASKDVKIERYVPAVPILTASLFLIIFLSPSLFPVLFVVIIFRTGNFAITKPSRELYYSIRPGMNKYKGFLDAAVYRSGDLLGALFFAGLNSVGAGVAFKSLAIMPLVFMWYYASKKVSVILK